MRDHYIEKRNKEKYEMVKAGKTPSRFDNTFYAATLKEIAEELKVSRQRVNQIIQDALKKCAIAWELMDG